MNEVNNLGKKEAESFPLWIEKIDRLYDEKYISLCLKLHEQISKIIDGETSNIFTDNFLKELKNPGLMQPIKCFLKSIKATYGIDINAIDFYQTNREIIHTINNLSRLIKDITFMLLSQDVFSELKRIPIYRN
jgi:hypothetical protein